MMKRPHKDRSDARLDRQFKYLGRNLPYSDGPLRHLRTPGLWMVRLPLGLSLIAGGFLAILPFFGLWMIPLGLLLLAIDVPPLKGPVAAALIRGRRWAETRWPRRRPKAK